MIVFLLFLSMRCMRIHGKTTMHLLFEAWEPVTNFIWGMFVRKLRQVHNILSVYSVTQELCSLMLGLCGDVDLSSLRFQQ